MFYYIGLIMDVVSRMIVLYHKLYRRDAARTATEMDGTLHTDFRKSETSRAIKKYY